MTGTDPRALGLSLMREHAIVGGRPTGGARRLEVEDPADESVVGAVPDLGPDVAEASVAAAAAAFATWSRTRPSDRAAVMRRWERLVEERAEALGALLAVENGKPFAEAVGEIRYAASFIGWFASEAERLNGETVDSPLGQLVLTFREPVGPTAAITPWNFPAAMIARKAAAALAAGCTVVVKPAPQTPFSAIALAELALEAGLPEGALDVVTGEAAALGAVLTGSPLIRKLSFTGSTPVGRLLAAQCAPTLKRVSLELGGAAALVVFDDADVELAVAETIKGKFRNSGQTCVCPNRIYVQAGVRTAYLEALSEAVRALPVGPAFAEGVRIGPLIDRKGLAKVERHVAEATASGARILVGGTRHEAGARFFAPTVLDGGDDALFRREETFGPVAPVFAFRTEDEARALCDDTEYGLAAYLMTRDLDRAVRVSRGLQAGVVGVNAGLLSNAVVPFGGVKQSGYGREGSTLGIDEYLQVKAVAIAAT